MPQPQQINTTQFEIDVFEGSKRITDPVAPTSPDQVVQEYADKYTAGDKQQLFRQMHDQGYNASEVLSFAVDNPYGYNEFRELSKKRAEAPRNEALKPEDYLNLTSRSIGEEGLLWNDVDPNKEGFFGANPTDPNFAGISAARLAFPLSEAQEMEIKQWEEGYDIDGGTVGKWTEDNLKKRGIGLGTEEYFDAYDEEYKKVFNQLMLAQATGDFVGTVRLSADELTKPRDRYLNAALLNASPQVRYIGIGRDNQHIYVSEAIQKYTMDAFDFPKMAAIGILKYGTDWHKALAERPMAAEEGFELGKASGIPGAQYLGGALGFVADIISPDATVLLGGAGKAAKMSGLLDTASDLRKSLGVTTGTEQVVKDIKSIQEGFELYAKTGNADDLAKASAKLAKLQEENKGFAKSFARLLETQEAEKTLQLTKILDSGTLFDDLAEEAKEVLRASGRLGTLRKVTSELDPEFAHLQKRVELRPGVRKSKVEGAEGIAPSVDISDFIKYENYLRELDEAAAKIKKAGEYRTTARQVGEEFHNVLKAQIKAAKEAGDKKLAKRLNVLRKDAGELQEDILKVVEYRAGIGGHSDADFAKSMKKIEQSLVKGISDREIKKISDVSDVASKEELLREAKKTQAEVDSLIQDVKDRLADLGRETQRLGAGKAAVEAEINIGMMEKTKSKAILDRLVFLEQLRKKKAWLQKNIKKMLEDDFLEKIADADMLAKIFPDNEKMRARVVKAIEEYEGYKKAILQLERTATPVDLADEMELLIEAMYDRLKKTERLLTDIRFGLKGVPAEMAAQVKKAARQRYKMDIERIKYYRNAVKAWAADMRKVNEEIRDIRKLEKALEGAPALIKGIDDFQGAATDALQKTFDIFYKSGKTGEALKQLERTRQGINYNVKAMGEALGVMAEKLSSGARVSASIFTDTSRTRQLKETPSFKNLLIKQPNLDPDAVPHAADLLATKYGVTAESILEAIDKGAPLSVNGQVLDADLLAKTQIDADIMASMEIERASPRYSLKNAIEGIDREQATGAIDAMLAPDPNVKAGSLEEVGRRVLGFVRDAAIGGAVNPNMVNLSEPLARQLQRIPRAISQTVGDVSTLLREKNVDDLVTYLSGKNGTFQNGRPIMSSGLPSVPSAVSLTMTRALDGLRLQGKVKEADAVEWLLTQPLNLRGRIDIETLKTSKATRAKYVRAENTIKQMLKGGAGAKAKQSLPAVNPDQGENVLIMPRMIVDVLDYVQPDYINAQEITVETMSLLHTFFNAGRHIDDQEEAARTLIFGIQKAYQSTEDTQRGALAVHRSLPILAAHTQASSIINQLGDINISISQKDYKNWLRYLNGMSVDDEWRSTTLQNMIDMAGDTATFEKIEVLGEQKFIPSAAKTAMNMALARANDASVKVLKGALSDQDAMERFLQHVVTKSLATRVTGAYVFRSRFGIDMLYEGFNNAMQIGGLAPATIHVTRMFSQIPVMFPGVLTMANIAERPASIMRQLTADVGELDGAVKYVKEAADWLANTAGSEGLQKFFGQIGDKGANLVAKFFGAGKWQPDINKLLAGADEVVEIGGKVYTYKQLRKFAVQAGVPGGSFQANYLSTHLRASLTGFGEKDKAISAISRIAEISAEEAYSFHDVIQSFAETLGERERMSMFASFIASGYEPSEAAKMTVRALHDYQQTLSEFDYSLFVRLFIPFWSFTKNNARLQLNTLLDPMAAYRAGIVRNMAESGVSLIQEVANDVYMDELGVQTGYLSPEVKAQYENYKSTMLQKLGQTRFTPEQKAVLRAGLMGLASDYNEMGRVFGTSFQPHEVRRLRDIIGVSEFMQPNPYVAGYVKEYQQGRPIFFFPSDVKAPGVQERRNASLPSVYNYLALPESGQSAFMAHIMNLVGAAYHIGMGVTAPIHGITNAEAQFEAVSGVLENIAQPDFLPVNNLAMEFFGVKTADGHRPVRVSKAVFEITNTIGWDVVWESEAKEQAGVETKEKKYYMSAWAAAVMGLSPVAIQGSREAVALFENDVGVSGEPMYDFGLTFGRLAGFQIERGDPEQVKALLQQRFSRMTFRPTR